MYLYVIELYTPPPPPPPLMQQLQFTVCNATVTISKDHEGPVSVGGRARFECLHGGPEIITWIINGYYYTTLNLPEKHMLDDDNLNAMIVSNIDQSMNQSSYQCVANSILSNIIYLYVRQGTMALYFFMTQIILLLFHM